MNIPHGKLTHASLEPISDSDLPSFLLDEPRAATIRPYPGSLSSTEDDRWPWPKAARFILALSILSWALIIGAVYGVGFFLRSLGG